MGDTSISWTDKTWNPIRGCSRVSEGCRHCYAERVAARFSGPGQPYEGLARMRATLPGIGKSTVAEPRWTGEVRMVPEHLADPLRWRKPCRVFVNSMSDLFHERLTNEQIAAVFGVMAASGQHTHQMLTKRARRMPKWFAWIVQQAKSFASIAHACWDYARKALPALASSAWDSEFMNIADAVVWPLPNVWIGCSVEDQEAADERIPELLATPAAVRFLSCEPLIAPLRLHEWLGREHGLKLIGALPGLRWIIAGCESGPGARECDVAWLRSLRDQCANAGVSFFLKQAVETDLGRCGDADNPNGDRPCGKRVTAHVVSPDTAAYSCGCTVEGAELGVGVPLGFGDGSKRKAGGVIELPYLDGVQHKAFPVISNPNGVMERCVP